MSVESINTPEAEWFYWCTILFSQTLGPALGDRWPAPTHRHQGADQARAGLGDKPADEEDTIEAVRSMHTPQLAHSATWARARRLKIQSAR